jgi:hypothetical protein
VLVFGTVDVLELINFAARAVTMLCLERLLGNSFCTGYLNCALQFVCIHLIKVGSEE